MNEIIQKRLKELLTYDRDTGVFRWKVNRGRARMGTIAGSIKGRGYKRITIDERDYRTHRLVWLYIHGYFPKETDHLNHNRSDNRLCNLREVSRAENSKNKSISKRNTSGTVGVCWYKLTKKWMAYIGVNGKLKNLGYFDDIKNAKEAREQAKIKYKYHLNHA